MEHFEIKNQSLIAIRKGLGILIIITSFLSLFLFISTSKIAYIFSFVGFIFLGIYQITNGLGLERSWFRTGSDFITIKWMNSINPVQIHNARIAKICLMKIKILVYRKAGNPVKLRTEWLEAEKKKEVYEFLIEYSKKRNLVLIRDFK